MTSSFDHVETLAELRTIALSCTDCSLAGSRTTVVFGDGRDDADVMIVGEGPGKQEDEQGIPFVGRSGQLLESLLAEIALDRKDVYIANVVKCRPPNNRDPRGDEIDACKGYLRRQIQLIDPTVVITLGNFSTKLLLHTTTGITRLRGTSYEWWGRFLVPTFHPAAALRGGEGVKNDIRNDLGLVRAILDGRLTADTQQPTADMEPSSADEVRETQMGLFGETS